MAFDFYSGDTVLIHPNEVYIGKTAISMPLEKILLARKNSGYCAIKFTKFWTGKTTGDLFAEYEWYYQKDGTGDFSKKNVRFKKEGLSFPKLRGIHPFNFSFGNKEIRCGTVRLFWQGDGLIAFYGEGMDQGDYGNELSPTKWTDISQVNVFDHRLKWYKYDDNRKEVNIPVDKLWDGK